MAVHGDTATARIRSLLPYTLTVRLTLVEHRVEGPACILEAALTGDLEGRARWTLTRRGHRTRAVYEQDVHAAPPCSAVWRSRAARLPGQSTPG